MERKVSKRQKFEEWQAAERARLTDQCLAPGRRRLSPPLHRQLLVLMCSPWEQTERRALLCRTEPLLRKQLLEDRKMKTNFNFPVTCSAPKPKFHHTYPRKDSFEEAREKAVRHALTDTSLHIRLTETDKYLEPQLVAEWWERCVHQTPPHEWLKTGDCHTSQDLKRRISLQLKRLWCVLMVLWG